MSVQTNDFVASSVSAASAELASSGDPLVAVRVKETSGSEVVYLASKGTESPAYVLKLRKPLRLIPATARKREQLSAVAEYDAIGKVARYFAGIPQFARSVPRPIRLLREHDAFVTEFIEGRSLKDILPLATGLFSTASSRSALRSVCYKCGVWLGLQHQMPIPESLPSRAFDLERLRQKSDTAVALLPESTRQSTAIRDLSATADEYARPIPDDVTCHGDFQPGNIFVRDGEPFVIDFGTMGVGPAEDDLAFFLVLMATQKFRIVLGNTAGNPRFTVDLCDAFFDGYGSKRAAQLPALKPLVAVYMLERLAAMFDTTSRLPRLARPIVRARLNRWVERDLTAFLMGLEHLWTGRS